MKRTIKVFIVLLLSILPFSSEYLLADPPDPPASHGSTSNSSGGGAPIGGGLFILLGLGAAYGGKKVYDMMKQSIEE